MTSDTANDKVSLELDDIQGMVCYGYDSLPSTRYVFLKVRDDKASAAKARAWIGKMATQLATARPLGPKEPKPEKALQLAFTTEGLAAIGFDQQAINTFPGALQSGMANPYRSKILGDVDTPVNGGGTVENAPEHWDFGGPANGVIHVLLIIYARSDEILAAEYEAQKKAFRAADIGEVHTEDGYRRPDGKEHFGFLDGMSQPAVEGKDATADDGQPPIRAGEFILGYRNEYGELPFSPSVLQSQDPASLLPQDSRNPLQHDLGRNGTFLVFRKYKQNVGAFWRFVSEATKKDGAIDKDASVRFASRIVGRWPSGAPLSLTPDKDNPALAANNAFLFGNDGEDDAYNKDKDVAGLRCPIGAHVRRTNPRDSLPSDKEASLAEARRHRLIRRGRVYGPIKDDLFGPDDDADPEKERGLHFVAINANISRQFEFMLQVWVNSPKSNKLQSDPDPLIGTDPGRPIDRNMTVQSTPVRKVYPLPSFVTIKGGGYYFLPGLRALAFMSGETYVSKGGAVEDMSYGLM